MTTRPRPFLLVAALLGAGVLSLIAGCGGGGGGGGSGSGQVDVLIQDSPVDELLAFRTVVEELRLESVDGRVTPNLIGSEVELEFLGLRDRAAWMTRTRLSPGPYHRALLKLRDRSAHAVGRNGERRRMNVTTHELVAPIDPPFQPSASARLVVDLDLAESLEEEWPGAPLEFVPTGTARSLSRGQGPMQLRSMHGVVRTPTADGFLVEAFGDADRLTPLGRIEVELEKDATLWDSDGSVFGSQEDFRRALVAGNSFVEVRGDLAPSGKVQARFAEILDQDRGRESESFAEVEGIVDSIPTRQGFALMIRSIAQGAARVERALERLGNPPAIEISIDEQTRFVADDGNKVVAADLALGQVMRVRFSRFDDEPFGAARILLVDRNPFITGEIVDVAELPGHVTVHLFPDDPNIRAGRVESADTDIRVDLVGAELLLQGEDELRLRHSQLRVGQRVAVVGPLTGPPDAPEVDAFSLTVAAGRLEGGVRSVDPGRPGFEMGVCRLIDSFGEGVDAGGSVEVRLLPSTRYAGDATSEAEFFDLYYGLRSDEVLAVKVRGVADDDPGEIVATEVRARVRERLGHSRELWPPNHRLVSVCLFDLDDVGPGDGVEIDGITQDEPVNGKGDGNTSPDAHGRHGAHARIRAERAGGGNGRVYRIGYTIRPRDGGDPRHGSVEVTVPHSQNGDTAIDDGQDYDSTRD